MNNGQSHDKEFMPDDAFHCITAVNDYSSKQILQLSRKKTRMFPGHMRKTKIDFKIIPI